MTVFPIPANDDDTSIRRLAAQMLEDARKNIPGNAWAEHLTADDLWDEAVAAYMKGARARE